MHASLLPSKTCIQKHFPFLHHHQEEVESCIRQMHNNRLDSSEISSVYGSDVIFFFFYRHARKEAFLVVSERILNLGYSQGNGLNNIQEIEKKRSCGLKWVARSIAQSVHHFAKKHITSTTSHTEHSIKTTCTSYILWLQQHPNNTTTPTHHHIPLMSCRSYIMCLCLCLTSKLI